MIGKSQNRFGLEDNKSNLDGFNAEITIADRLKQAGYVTAQFGKWHLASGSNTPLTRGGWTNYAGGLGGGLPDYTNWTKTVNGTSTADYTNYATTDVVDDAVSWINTRGTNTWFAWVAFRPDTELWQR